jgi:hypothetical protein
VLERWIESVLPGIDVVVISLPPDDASFGWDYPRLRQLLERRSVPHALLHSDPAQPIAAFDRERIEALLTGASARREACFG